MINNENSYYAKYLKYKKKYLDLKQLIGGQDDKELVETQKRAVDVLIKSIGSTQPPMLHLPLPMRMLYKKATFGEAGQPRDAQVELEGLVDGDRRRPVIRGEPDAVGEHVAEQLAAVEQRHLQAQVESRPGGVGLQLDRVQGDAEVAFDAGRGDRRVAEGHHAQGRRHGRLPAK